MSAVPPCPVCESVDHVAFVGHAAGEFMCGPCDLLFNGGGQEWIDMAERRAEHHDRRDNPREPLPVQTPSARPPRSV